MMENKISTFAALPKTELSKISDDAASVFDPAKARSIESEFNETNKHTQQTPDNTDYTPNTENIENSTTDVSDNTTKNRLGGLMQGTFAVNLVDMLVPSLVVLLIGYVGYSMEKKDLQLTKSEKETLAPAVQDVLDHIKIDFSNPWVNLAIMLSIVYGSKIIDKVPALKRKVISRQQDKQDMTEGIAAVMNEARQEGEVLSDMGKFQIDYGKLVDTVRLARKRGVGDAKQYIADNYNEQIKAIADKYKIPLSAIQNELNYVHTVKKRAKRSDNETDFSLE